MMGGIKPLRRLQFGDEADAGTPVVATAIWRGENALLDDQRQIVFPPEDIGIPIGTDRSYIPMFAAGITLPNAPATFEQLPYLLEMGIKAATPAADGGGSGYIYDYPIPVNSVNSIRSYTFEGGDNQDKEEVEYCFANQVRLTGKGSEGLMMSAELIGRQVTRGPVVTGTGIAFVASTKKITDTAAGLAGFVTGTTIKVTGSVDNDGIYTVATGGVAGEIVVTETLVDGAATPSITIQDWFSGGPTGVAPPTVEEILFSKGKLYVDAVGGTIGSTLVSNSLRGMDLDYLTGVKPEFTADGELYFSYAHVVRPVPKVRLTFVHDAHGVGRKVDMRAQTARLFRLEWLGSALGTAGDDHTYKTLRLDFAAKVQKASQLGEENDNDILTVELLPRYNSTGALSFQALVVNELSALP